MRQSMFRWAMSEIRRQPDVTCNIALQQDATCEIRRSTGSYLWSRNKNFHSRLCREMNSFLTSSFSRLSSRIIGGPFSLTVQQRHVLQRRSPIPTFSVYIIIGAIEHLKCEQTLLCTHVLTCFWIINSNILMETHTIVNVTTSHQLYSITLVITNHLIVTVCFARKC